MACKRLSLVVLAILSCSTPAFAADVVATRNIQRGSIVTAADLSGAEGRDHLIGLEAVRTVRAGSVVSASQLRSPRLVRRNDTVALIFTQGRLTMETTGRSLGEGGEGDLISVMNMNSRKRVSGRIIGQGRVEVSK